MFFLLPWWKRGVLYLSILMLVAGLEKTACNNNNSQEDPHIVYVTVGTELTIIQTKVVELWHGFTRLLTFSNVTIFILSSTTITLSYLYYQCRKSLKILHIFQKGLKNYYYQNLQKDANFEIPWPFSQLLPVPSRPRYYDHHGREINLRQEFKKTITRDEIIKLLKELNLQSEFGTIPPNTKTSVHVSSGQFSKEANGGIDQSMTSLFQKETRIGGVDHTNKSSFAHQTTAVNNQRTNIDNQRTNIDNQRTNINNQRIDANNQRIDANNNQDTSRVSETKTIKTDSYNTQSPAPNLQVQTTETGYKSGTGFPSHAQGHYCLITEGGDYLKQRELNECLDDKAFEECLPPSQAQCCIGEAAEE